MRRAVLMQTGNDPGSRYMTAAQVSAGLDKDIDRAISAGFAEV